ncbi:hypothetical protein SJPD1_2288 [Sulfurospirillum diekertiae]|uniref:Uncharacterized protein n=1 Tax=Sulfurospirillum diekertiae TaxID=1854492 RepID=A0A290HUQ9_9BACT|nr:hypothetical protein [Sulfurospirillum diekertiae]ATB70384.1 hypothetical protein SJPD1_2288 [Sulfurospirillum diekertiae]
MRLNSLQSLGALKQIKGVPQIKPLIRTIVTIDKSNLSQIALINHSASLGLYAMRILRDEIRVKNKAEILAVTLKEIKKLSTMLSKNNNEDTITRKEAKETFKKIRLKPKHIKT